MVRRARALSLGVLASSLSPDTVVTAWAANAGHTYIDINGRKYVHTMLANGVVSRNLRRVLIGPGSLIDPHALGRELTDCWGHVGNTDILIHPHAAVITQAHRDAEEAGSNTKIGSTKKGVGEAAIQRIRRDPDDMNIAKYALDAMHHPLRSKVCTIEQYNNAVDDADCMLVEGAQGFSLSMYHGFYPYCTSRDVSTAQVMADCGLPIRLLKSLDVVGTVRAFPIRVANRFNPEGQQVGWSGPCYDDQRELDWRRDLGREPELTTVTKLPRRIFTLSRQQLREAIRICGVDQVFLNFVNYCPSPDAALRLIDEIDVIAGRQLAYVSHIGMGPADNDVFDIYSDHDDTPEGDRTALRDLDSWVRARYTTGRAGAHA
jgi:adenylosuccinate synthase